MSDYANALATTAAELSPVALGILQNTLNATSPEGISTSEVHGWFVQNPDPGQTSLVLWVVASAPGLKLLRVEVTESAALAITWPITRVSRLAELYDANGYVVTVETDADGWASFPNHETGQGRSEFTRYEIRAAAGTEAESLQLFARGLSSALGTI